MLKKYISRGYLFLISIFPIIYFFLIRNRIAIFDETIIIKLDKQFSFVSWSITAITSILAFGILYLTILLEKNLFNNMNKTKDFYKPYHIEKKEIKNYIYGNRNSRWKSGLLIFFIIFSISTFFINLFWVTCINYYTKYNFFDFNSILSFSWVKEINVMSDILAAIIPFTFWTITTAINILIYMILVESKALIKFKIPSLEESLDVNFLKNQDTDLSEIFYKAGPRLVLYDKYEDQKQTLELCLEKEIPWKNYYLIFKFYKGKHIKYKLYCKDNIEESEKTNRNYEKVRPESIVIDLSNSELENGFFDLLKNYTDFADVSLYNMNYEELGNFKLSLTKNLDQSIFIPFRQILHDEKNNIEKGRLEIMRVDFDLEKVEKS